MLTERAKILISENELKEKIHELGVKISADYQGEEVLFVGILKGCIHFYSDLTREITIPMSMDFMAISSYGAGTTSSGEVKMLKDLDKSICGKNVIIVEDIIDTGRTLNDIVKMLQLRNPLSLHVVTLLDKPSRRVVDFKADISLFTIPDHFVIGYGLDCGEYFRNLPYIAEYGE